MSFDTLEEARAEIVRLNGVVTEITNERDTFSQNNKSLNEELEKVRNLNQSYFERLCMQNSTSSAVTNNEEKEAVSCVEFARTLKY